MSEKYLLFDLDGTLTDPGEGITNCVRYALEKFGVHPRDREELYPYIGPPLTASFQEFHHLSAEQAEEALGYYRERFSTIGMFENRPYDGIDSFLQRLCEEGYHLMIATSKPEEFTIQILEHFNLARFFEFVCGNTLEETRPTKESVIRCVMEHFPTICRENTLMIGDRKYDIMGAHSCGLRGIGVLYGYGDEAELTQCGADATAADLMQLERVIHTLLPC